VHGVLCVRVRDVLARSRIENEGTRHRSRQRREGQGRQDKAGQDLQQVLCDDPGRTYNHLIHVPTAQYVQYTLVDVLSGGQGKVG